MRLNPSKTWFMGLCGGVAIDYGKSVTKNESKNTDEGHHHYLGKHIH
jgi:hypothetical protein